MSVSHELLQALTISERPELLLSLDEQNGLEFFRWAHATHPEYIITTPDWELVRKHIVRTGEIPIGVVVSDKPRIEADEWFLQQTQPKEEP